MDKKTITLAQIGCGYWGPNLLRNFSAQPNCHVKYVVDLSEERRRYVESNYPRTSAISSVEDALADPAVNAVAVATPAANHFEIALHSLERGKHVFVEKPLAMSVAECVKLLHVAGDRHRTLMVGHTFLYNAAVEYLKNLVLSKTIGDIYYVYAQRLNLGVIRSDINAMWNLAPHDISIISYILGQQPVAVSASGTDYIQKGIEDVVFMNLVFGNRIHANIHVSWLDPNKVRKIIVVGSKKMVVYDDIGDDKITIYDKGIDVPGTSPEMLFDNLVPQKLIHRAGDILIPRVDFKEPLKLETGHFLQCIVSGAVPKSDGRNGLDVVAVLEAASRSLRNGSMLTSIDRQLPA